MDKYKDCYDSFVTEGDSTLYALYSTTARPIGFGIPLLHRPAPDNHPIIGLASLSLPPFALGTIDERRRDGLQHENANVGQRSLSKAPGLNALSAACSVRGWW
jgi:hypothetical protein